MRASQWFHTGAALLLSAGAGCSPSTQATSAARTASPGAPAAKPSPAAPAIITFSATTSGGTRQIVAVSEDGAGSPVTLSASGVDTVFVAALAGRRALLAERDGSGVARLTVAASDGTRRALGDLPAGRYQGAGKAVASGDLVIAELVREGATDLFVLRAGAQPLLLSAGAQLVTVAGDRAAFLAAGNLASVKLDGSGLTALGGGDGQDQIVEVRGSRLLVTVHATLSGHVRVVSVDGSGRADLGQPGTVERAFGFAVTATSDRLVFTRLNAASGAVAIHSAALDGTDDRVLTTPLQAAVPLAIATDGTVIFTAAGGALMSVAATGGAAHVLDVTAGEGTVVSRFAAGRVIYLAQVDTGLSLRAARLDGTGSTVTVLCERPLWLPFVTAVTADDRVVFHRALSGQLEGGQAFSVNLDGSDLRPMGTQVLAADGSKALSPADQDFEAITPGGHVILEAEYEGAGPRQLLVATPGAATARALTGLTGIRFAGLLP